MLKLLVGYLHLLAASLALGAVLTADWRLYRGRHYPFRPGTLSRLRGTKRLTIGALMVLWVTGALLVWFGYAAESMHYLANPKLWAKVSVVLLLTANGLLLHLMVFPGMVSDVALMELPPAKRYGFAALGAVSCASWLYAAFLGIARPWNFSVHYGWMMALYLVLAAGAVFAAVAIFTDRLTAARAVTAAD